MPLIIDNVALCHHTPYKLQRLYSSRGYNITERHAGIVCDTILITLPRPQYQNTSRLVMPCSTIITYRYINMMRDAAHTPALLISSFQPWRCQVTNITCPLGTDEEFDDDDDDDDALLAGIIVPQQQAICFFSSGCGGVIIRRGGRQRQAWDGSPAAAGILFL